MAITYEQADGKEEEWMRPSGEKFDERSESQQNMSCG